MASKETVLSIPEGYKISRMQSDGTEKIVASLHGVARTDSNKAVGMFLGFIAKESDKQSAALSILCDILDGALADMEKHRNRGDKTKGQLSDAIKETFRDAESAHFKAMLDKGHKNHTAYIKGLPKINVDGDPISKDDNVDERHAYFLTRLRKEPSYAAAKNLVLNLWAFVGEHPFDNAKGAIQPPQVMRVKIAAAKDVANDKPTFAQQLAVMLRECYMPADPKNPPAITPEECAMLLRELESARDGIIERINSYKARAEKGDIKAAADAAVKDARAEPALM